MLTAVQNVWTALSWSSLALIVIALIVAYKYGWPKMLSIGTAIANWWNTGIADLKAAQSALAGEVGVLRADFDAVVAHFKSTGTLPASVPPAPPAPPTAPPLAH